MYAQRPLASSLSGIESLNFAMYWRAIKDRIGELRNLPTWATNHAMKLGLVVSQLEREGNHKAIAGMDYEIRKVNDDIAKAWKVKGYIDKWLPDWMAASAVQSSGTPIVAPQAYPTAPTAASFGIRQEAEEFGPATMRQAYVAPTIGQQITGWFKSVVGLNDYSAERIPSEHGLGVLPLVAVAVSIPALAYVVTTGMALYQDYSVKKDLTAEVIRGKLTSGQVKDILTGPRPSEPGIFSGILTGVGTNIGTMAVIGLVGYLGFMYLMTPKRGE